MPFQWAKFTCDQMKSIQSNNAQSLPAVQLRVQITSQSVAVVKKTFLNVETCSIMRRRGAHGGNGEGVRGSVLRGRHRRI